MVKGFQQQYGIDYDETYASVVKPMAFCALFAIAAYYDLNIDQMDVKTAFLYGIIKQLIYVKLPLGYEKPGIVCRLQRGLYGLKQSSRLWYQRISEYLAEKIGLTRLHADHGIFATSDGIRGPIISIWVDDLNLFTPRDSPLMQKMKDLLILGFQMVDGGPITYYLGLKVDRNRAAKTIKLSQPAYIEKILHTFGLLQAKTSTTPMKESSLLGPNPKEATPKDIKKFQAIVGSIMFAMLETRPDIAFATSAVSRYAQNPSSQHIEAAKTILRYLSGTRQKGITYGGHGGNLNIVGYSDADWAGDKVDRKSTSGFIFMMNNGPISWCSKKQTSVALSSTEAEYMALTLAAKEATWLRLLLTELGLLDEGNQHAKIALRGDNQSAIALGSNPILHQRTKHIDIQHHYIRDEVEARRIELKYVPTAEMIADGLTKPLLSMKFHAFIKQLGMASPSIQVSAAPPSPTILTEVEDANKDDSVTG